MKAAPSVSPHDGSNSRVASWSSPIEVVHRVLGSNCRYLISSGFNFGDDHINDSLIHPSIENGSIALTNFCGVEPEKLSSVRARPNVMHICSDKKLVGGRETVEDSELWKFSEFVKLF